jgi:predicted nuclease of predicted toxin-antitoxin system
LVADECVPRQVVERLRADGHQVTYVLEEAPSIPDETVLQKAAIGGVPVLTEDTDFGELVYQSGKGSSGVVLLRLKGLSPEAKAVIVAGVVRDYASAIPSSFVVVTPGRVRVRRFES